MGGVGSGARQRPTADKLREGYRKDRVNKNEPQPTVGVIEPPEHLSTDALAVWARLAPDLIGRGVLTAWDRDEFGVFCQAVADIQDVQKTLNSEGQIITNTNGNLVPHPAVAIRARLTQTMVTVGARFGMSPADRASLSIAPPKQRSAADDPESFL